MHNQQKNDLQSRQNVKPFTKLGEVQREATSPKKHMPRNL